MSEIKNAIIESVSITNTEWDNLNKERKNMETNPYIPWARTVYRLLRTEKEMIKTIKWWKSKKAKLIWGTKRTRLQRNALKYVLKETKEYCSS